MDLYIFTPNGDTSSTDFLGNPFLPVNIAPASAPYASIQLLCILSTDAPNGCPFYNAVHTLQLMNQTTTAQTQAENSFTFDVPADQTDAQYVIDGNLVAFLDLDGNYQLFEIQKVDEYHTDTLYKTAYCVNAGPAELIDEWVDNVVLNEDSASYALGAVLNGTRWMVGNVNLTNSDTFTIQRTSTLSALAALIAQYGGEMQFRVTISGTGITGMYVDWLQTVGNVTGKRFEYGKDTVSVHRTVGATQTVKTALYGYGQQDSNGNYVTFTNVTWSTANGDPVDKPPGQSWVGDPNALTNWGRAGGTRNRFGSFSDSQQTDPTALLQETWNNLQTINTPPISYEMSVVDLETLAGYSWEAIRIGDTVNVIDTTFQPVLRLTARVVEIQRDLIEPTNTQVTLGNFLPTLAGAQPQLVNVQQTGTSTFDGGIPNTLTSASPVPTYNLQGIINALSNEVQAEGAYAYLTDSDGLIVYDKPKDQNPTKAIKLGAGILAIASSKNANGQWNWTTFGTGDGFTANLINAGTIDAITVTITNLNASNINQGKLTGIEVDLSDATGANTAKLTGGKSQTYTANYAGSGWNITQTTDGSGMNFSASGASGSEFAGINYIAGMAAIMQAGNSSTTGIQTYNDKVWTKNNILDDGATGNMTLGGSFTAAGTKSAVVKTKHFGWRKLYAVESPENWFEDFGEAKTNADGASYVTLEPIFAETVDTSKCDYLVFIQGIDAPGLKVRKRDPKGFIIFGHPNTRFMYRIIAKRLGYTKTRLEEHRTDKPPSLWQKVVSFLHVSQ